MFPKSLKKKAKQAPPAYHHAAPPGPDPYAPPPYAPEPTVEYPPDASARHVAGWEIPPVSALAEEIRYGTECAIDAGFDRPEDLPAIALPGLVSAIGKLEVQLLEANQRIEVLEEALDYVLVMLRRQLGQD